MDANVRATASGQKQMMARAVGMSPDAYATTFVRYNRAGDYGADPIGDGMFRMVPSGDVVDYTERTRRLANVGK